MRLRVLLELRLYRAEHAEPAVSALAVMPDLEVVEERVGEFNAGGPALPVEEFDLHWRPERFDHGVVVAVADAAHRRQETRGFRAVGECPRPELTGLNQWTQHQLVRETLVAR